VNKLPFSYDWEKISRKNSFKGRRTSPKATRPFGPYGRIIPSEDLKLISIRSETP